MINLFQDIPEETIETTLDMIQRNLDQIGLYGGHTIRKHTDVQVLALKTRLNAEDIKFETKKYWLEKSKLYGKQAILRWLQKENIDTTPNSWQERYHL